MADAATGHSTTDERVLEEISRALRNMEFGQLQVTVHAARVVEICTTEKKRLAR